MTELKWENPPETKLGRGSTKWKDVVNALRGRPGEWALVAENVSSSVAAFLRNTYPIEVTVRGVKGSKAAKIYARYPKASAGE